MTRKEVLLQRNFKHGLCCDESGKKTRLYNIWVRMKQRCYDKNASDYPRYGGRGIQVCDEWRKDYSAFHQWAIANGYNNDKSIERLDVNGNYCPENCSWITMEEQARNKRNSRRITYNGETKILAEWARELGIQQSLLRYRLNHWGIEKTFEIGGRKIK